MRILLFRTSLKAGSTFKRTSPKANFLPLTKKCESYSFLKLSDSSWSSSSKLKFNPPKTNSLKLAITPTKLPTHKNTKKCTAKFAETSKTQKPSREWTTWTWQFKSKRNTCEKPRKKEALRKKKKTWCKKSGSSWNTNVFPSKHSDVWVGKCTNTVKNGTSTGNWTQSGNDKCTFWINPVKNERCRASCTSSTTKNKPVENKQNSRTSKNKLNSWKAQFPKPPTQKISTRFTKNSKNFFELTTHLWSTTQIFLFLFWTPGLFD